jgi:hypothetical protein
VGVNVSVGAGVNEGVTVKVGKAVGSSVLVAVKVGEITVEGRSDNGIVSLLQASNRETKANPARKIIQEFFFIKLPMHTNCSTANSGWGNNRFALGYPKMRPFTFSKFLYRVIILPDAWKRRLTSVADLSLSTR